MLTFNEAPWVEYLEIDEETGQRKLRANTPQEIREKYEKHCLKQERNADEMRPK